jgi:PAS domain S-box-containing protein
MNDQQVYSRLGRKVRELENDITAYLHGLEERVQARALELERTNRKLKAEINGRKRAQQELGKVKREWEITFDAMVDWVSLVDLDRTIIRSNRRGEEMFPVPVQDMVGLNICEVLHGADCRVPGCPMPAAVASGQRESVELQLSDGRWMMISIDPIVDENNRLLNVVHICRDITERKAIEIEREQMVTKLQAALADVKTLSGLLPICSVCKKIRDDKGYWSQIEAYIHKHSGTRFSHGICPDCAREHYPDLDLYKKP